MENIVKDIIMNKKNCYFVSPHLDDAILSAGGLLSQLAGKTKVTVINVFTQSTTQNTLSAKLAYKRAGFNNSSAYFMKRREEDARVMQDLGISVINLGFVDALWRQKANMNSFHKILGKFIPELTVIYPTYRYHVEKGKIAKDDIGLMKEITSALAIVEDGAVVFSPLGIGGHVDHLLITKICKKLKQRVIFWSDFPYNQGNQTKSPELRPVLSNIGVNSKAKHIKKYKTQISQMFPGGKVPDMEEIFYV